MTRKGSLLFIILLLLYSCAIEDSMPEFECQILPKPIEFRTLSDHYVDISDIMVEGDSVYTSRLPISEKVVDSLNVSVYHLTIRREGIRIIAGSATGLHYGRTSLQQLQDHAKDGKVPELEIRDWPTYTYRGMHLDVGRHMFDVADIKAYIDMLAYYKFNYFHWHLTEDQGWRIEIKKYPKLQEIAAYREETLIRHYNDTPHRFDGKRYGGYYSQAEIKEIVAHAQLRGVEIIPEIEMPGHSLAAIAAYPELACQPGKYSVATKWGVFEPIYCPTELTFQFLEDVIDEVITLFPSEYIHIGGDEAPKSTWDSSPYCQSLMRKMQLKDESELQSYFIARMEKYINGKGKKIIGWDEILEGGLAPNATVMSWRGIDGGRTAALQGHDVIMTPTSHCYFDYYQSDKESEPLAIGGLLPLKKVYHWDPMPSDIPPPLQEHILGGQGNVWTEYMPTFEQVEYMAYSRMMALSAVLWSGIHRDGYIDFLKVYRRHQQHWKDQGVNISDHTLEISYGISQNEDKELQIQFENDLDDLYIISQNPDGKIDTILGGQVYPYDANGEYRFVSLLGDQLGDSLSIYVERHRAFAQEISLEHAPSNTYSGFGPISLINGILGSDSKYSGNEWLGFEGRPLVAHIQFDEPLDIREVSIRAFNAPGQWIYPPSSLEVMCIYDDGSSPTTHRGDIVSTSEGKIAIAQVDEINARSVDRIDIILQDHGTIAEGAQGAGHRAWLFVDEINIK